MSKDKALEFLLKLSDAAANDEPLFNALHSRMQRSILEFARDCMNDPDMTAKEFEEVLRGFGLAHEQAGLAERVDADAKIAARLAKDGPTDLEERRRLHNEMVNKLGAWKTQIDEHAAFLVIHSTPTAQ